MESVKTQTDPEARKRAMAAEATRKCRERQRVERKEQERQREVREERARYLREDNARARREIERTREQIQFLHSIWPQKKV